MSAINDALRRASSAAKSNVAPAAPAPTPEPAGSFSTAPAPMTNAAPPPPPLPPMPVAPPPPPAAPVATALPPRIDELNAGLPPLPAAAVVSRPRNRVLPAIFAVLALLCAAGAAASYLYAKKHGPVLKVAALEMDDNESSSDGDETEAESAPAAKPAPAAVTPPKAAAPVSAAPAVPTATPAPAPAPAPRPVAPVSTTPVKFPPLRLQSIFYRPSNPSVMINGKTLFVSDDIQGATVVAIQPSSVTLVLSGQTNVLTLR